MSRRAAAGGAREDGVTELAAAPPVAIVERLLTMAREGEPGTAAGVPFATFVLRGARDVSGWLVDAQAQPPSLLVRLADPQGRRPGDAVVYVDAAHLAAVVVHDAGPWAARLAGRRPPVAEAPGRLVIERRLREVERDLAAITVAVEWDGIRDDEQSRWAVGELIDRAAAAFAGIGADLIGKRALRGLARVVIADGAANRVTRDGKELRIESPLSAPSAARFADLRAAIERTL